MLRKDRADELLSARKAQIISVCEKMYDEMDYHDITLKTISERTELSRPSLYNYYSTKEEIYLDILEKKYLALRDDLEKFLLGGKHWTKEETSQGLAKIIVKHRKLITMMGSYITDIEMHCSQDNLDAFKQKVKPLFDTLRLGIKRQFPASSEEDISGFVSAFMCFLHGLPAVCEPSARQIAALKAAGMYHAISMQQFCARNFFLLMTPLR